MMKRKRVLRAVSAVFVLALAGGCSSSSRVESGVSSSSSSTDPSSDSTTSTESTDSTTSSSSSTSSSTSTTIEVVEPLVLRGDGLGAFDVGTDVGIVYDGIVEQLGEPSSDSSVSYPVADGPGHYQTTEGEYGYVAPWGRSVCWSEGLCVEFGGATSAALSLTGWIYSADPPGTLFTTSGATLGTRWSDLLAMDVEAGGCYSVGTGSVDGVRLTVVSEGVPFSEFDESGNFVYHLPPPDDVTVVSMDAGGIPIFLFGDC